MRRVIDEDIPALMLSKTITIKELIKKYGNKGSDKVFSINDYKMYLLNNYLDEKYNAQKELENLVSDINKNS